MARLVGDQETLIHGANLNLVMTMIQSSAYEAQDMSVFVNMQLCLIANRSGTEYLIILSSEFHYSIVAARFGPEAKRFILMATGT